jgi:hypothetical protein
MSKSTADRYNQPNLNSMKKCDVTRANLIFPYIYRICNAVPLFPNRQMNQKAKGDREIFLTTKRKTKKGSCYH